MGFPCAAAAAVAAHEPTSRAAKGAFLRPDAAEVLAAARSLHADELRPFGRILLKRIRERAAAASAAKGGSGDIDDVPLIDPRQLRKLCECCTLFRVDPAEGREYAVTLFGERGIFVDPCNPLDPYPASLWKDAGDYFYTGGGRSERLPSGRYACAQLLMSRGTPFLRGRSLGEACHIVQLAISQKKILGYANGELVPYDQSEECAKESCALRQQPSGPSVETDVAFATWQDLRVGLVEVLRTSCNPSPGMVTLSNVKRLFRSQLSLELCETVLGHARVWELLQDPRLQDVCLVQGLGNGQAVVTLVQSPFTMAYTAGIGRAAQHYMAQMGQAMPLPLPPAPAMHSTCASNRMPAPWAPAPLPPPAPAGAGARGPLSTVPVAAVPMLPAAATACAPCQVGSATGHPAPAESIEEWPFCGEKSVNLVAMPPLHWDSYADDGAAIFMPFTAEAHERKSSASDTDCTSSVVGFDSSSSGSGVVNFFGLTESDSGALPALLRWDSEESEDESAPCGGYVVKNTFVDISLKSPQRQRRSRSVPKDAMLSPTRSSRPSTHARR